MQARRYLLVLLILLFVGIFTTVFVASAQSDVCGTVVRDASNESGTNCADQANGTVCAGHESVSRTTSSGVVSTTYTTGGDTANLATTHVISSGTLDSATGAYGINVLNVQGGLAAGSNLVYVLFGGATLTNVGGPGQAIWQNVALSTVANPAPCAGIPSMLLIQSPQGASTNVTVNGATLTVGSTIVVNFPAPGTIQFCVLDGAITVGGITVAAGQCITAQLTAAGVVITSSFSAPTLIPADALGAIQSLVLGLPSNLLLYVPSGIVVTCPSGIGQANCTVTTSP